MGFLYAAPHYGQKKEIPKNDCYFEVIDNKRTGRIICTISEDDPYPLGPVQVSNDTKIVVRIKNKSPFDDCTLADVKLTDIKESDPIVTILQLFTQAATGAKVPQGLSSATGGNATLADRLLSYTKQLSKDLKDSIDYTERFISKRQKPLVERVNEFVSSPPRNETEFIAKRGKALLDDLQTEYEQSQKEEKDRNNDYYLSDQNTIERRMVSSQTSYNSIREQVKTISDPKAADILQDLDFIAVQLAAFKVNYDAITASRVLFKPVLKILKSTNKAIIDAKTARQDTSIAFVQNLSLLPYNQQAASSSVTCTNSLTKKVAVSQIPVSFLFKKDSRLSVSVGPLLSTTAKQKLGTTAINTGVNSSGVPTFRSEFAVIDRAPYQIIPFAFFNYRIKEFGSNSNPAKPSPYSLHFSVGIGVNPNNGSNEVEYFVGSAFGIRKFLIQFGDHIGRFQEGFTGDFNVGDTVPASFPTTLPIRKVYKHGFGIALSYKLPL
jgi:hypothetical protein